MSIYNCNLCGTRLTSELERGVCPKCNCRPRVRTVHRLYNNILEPCYKISQNASPLCAVSASSQELGIVSPFYNSIQCISLYGKYGPNCLEGVDVRDMPALSSNYFSGFYTCLLFDYFTEHLTALSEIYRVLGPSGIFVTHIEPPRLTLSWDSPCAVKIIEPNHKTGYYKYIPESQSMTSTRVGIQWFLDAMESVGFIAEHFAILDAPSGYTADWFVGHKIV
jgi:hypothetical protein